MRSLLACGSLTLDRADAVAPVRWASALARNLAQPAASDTAKPENIERHPPPEFELVIIGPDELSPNLARLLEFAVDAILDGQVPAAERLLRRAQAVAPGDITSKLILRRIAMHHGERAQRSDATSSLVTVPSPVARQ